MDYSITPLLLIRHLNAPYKSGIQQAISRKSFLATMLQKSYTNALSHSIKKGIEMDSFFFFNHLVPRLIRRPCSSGCHCKIMQPDFIVYMEQTSRSPQARSSNTRQSIWLSAKWGFWLEEKAVLGGHRWTYVSPWPWLFTIAFFYIKHVAEGAVRTWNKACEINTKITTLTHPLTPAFIPGHRFNPNLVMTLPFRPASFPLFAITFYEM